MFKALIYRRIIYFFYHKSTQISQRRSVGALLFLSAQRRRVGALPLRAFVLKTIQHIIR